MTTSERKPTQRRCQIVAPLPDRLYRYRECPHGPWGTIRTACPDCQEPEAMRMLGA